MKQKVVILVTIFLIIFAGAYVFWKRSLLLPNNSTISQPIVENSSTTVKPTAKKSLRDLLELGMSQMCNFDDSESGSRGQVYVANQRMRSDFTVSSNGTPVNFHAILEGEKIYIWVDGEENGFVMPVSQSDQELEGTSGIPKGTVDITKQIDYDCSPWTVDDSMFILPKEVEFKDFNTMLQNIQESMPTGNSQNCASCDTLPPGSARDQCRTSLECE